MRFEGIQEKVFLDRYALKDKDGNLVEHTTQEMWKRVAWGIAQNEKENIRGYWESKFYKAMEGFKFVPGGRILSGAGTKYQVTYFNCFVIPSPKDSREGILEALKQLVEIQSRSGGVGLNLSSLRPRGTRVRKVNGTSSGPVTWAGLFSYATHDVVQQGGTRRGATMLMLWDWHPDIEEFITVKQDLSKINGANLSVCISDAFMEAVKKDADWQLVYPDLDDPNYDKKWDGELDEWKKFGGKVNIHKTIKARYLWDLICTAAWRSAEPGLHFLERSNKRSNTHYFEKLVATNPSLRAGTKVLTKKGIYPIELLENKKFLVKNLDGQWSEAECFLSGKNKALYKITLGNGREIFATEKHKWPVQLIGGEFGKVTTDKLQSGNILPFPNAEDIQFDAEQSFSKEEGFMLGWLYGDGWISLRGMGIQAKTVMPFNDFVNPFMRSANVRNFSPQPLSAVNSLISATRKVHNYEKTEFNLPKKEKWAFGFLFSEEDKVLAGKIENQVNKLKRVKSSLRKSKDNTYTMQVTSSEFAEKLALLYGVDEKEKGLPRSIWKSGSDFIKGFVDGLISSDGFIAKNANRVVFTTKHKKIAEDFSDLLSFYGIKNNTRRLESKLVKFPNGKNYYKTYERYDIAIDGYNAVEFGKIFALSHPRKQANLQRIINEYKSSRKSPDAGLIRIRSVEKTSIRENVWDISVYDDTHCFYINHCITGNCGEQPLGPWAVCNLGAMNLSVYVQNEQFDYKNFAEDVKIAMRFLDNVIDQTYYFFKENEKCAKDIRRTGLGIMGLGDALIKMKIRYGSKECEPVLNKIFKTLRDSAYEASSDIAREKGSFPKFISEKYLKGYHIKALPKALKDKIKKQGIRNAVLLTIAPTGTTSLVAGVTSGIEPVYEFKFLRRWRGGEEIVYHYLYDQWIKDHKEEEKPDYFVSANEMTPLDHARVQAIAQEYIDSSISKTVNAPSNHTIDDVKTLYMLAYDMGLKGITYMRDGSRQGVLERVNDAKKETKPKEILQPALSLMPVLPRPEKLEGVTYKVQTPLGITYVSINHLSEKTEPSEVFVTVGKSGSDVGAMAEALGRMISLSLRLNAGVSQREKVRQIVAQLVGIGGARSIGFGINKVRSLPDAIAKVLASHMGFAVNGKVEDRTSPGHSLLNGSAASHNEEEEIERKEEIPANQLSLKIKKDDLSATSLFDICPECGTGSFAYEEGCKKCYSCGYSEC